VTTEFAVRDQGAYSRVEGSAVFVRVATRHRRSVRFLRAWLNSGRHLRRAPPTAVTTRPSRSSAPRAIGSSLDTHGDVVGPRRGALRWVGRHRGNEMAATVMGCDLVPLTYVSNWRGRRARGNSLWRRSANSWRLLHHQGTRLRTSVVLAWFSAGPGLVHILGEPPIHPKWEWTGDAQWAGQDKIGK